MLFDIRPRFAREFGFHKSYYAIPNEVVHCFNDQITLISYHQRYLGYIFTVFPMLRDLRQAGRKVFLLTNSLWEYTQVVMNYLQGGSTKATAANRDFAWMEYFDLVIVGGNKPAFLLDEG